MKNILHCKLGTQPATIQLRYKYKLRKGLRIIYRCVTYIPYLGEGFGNWQTGMVDDINDLMIFISRM